MNLNQNPLFGAILATTSVVSGGCAVAVGLAISDGSLLPQKRTLNPTLSRGRLRKENNPLSQCRIYMLVRLSHHPTEYLGTPPALGAGGRIHILLPVNQAV